MEATIRRKATADQIFGDNKAPLSAVLDADFADLKADIEALLVKARAVNKAPQSDEEQAQLGNMILDLKAMQRRVDGVRAEEKKPILDASRELDAWFKGTMTGTETAVAVLQKKADDYVREQAAKARAKAQREAEELRAKEEAERAKSQAARTVQGAANADARAEQAAAQAERLEEAAAASAADLTRARVGGVTASAKGAWVARITDYPAAIAPLGSLGHFIKEEAVRAALGAMAKVQKAGASWPGVSFGQEEKAAFRR